MNLDDVRTIVQAVGDRDRPAPLLLPGSVGQVNADGVVEVAMDSDAEGTSIEARSLFADVAPGDRVMVLFDPPRGVYAVGLIGRTVEAGQLVAYFRGSVENVPYTTSTTLVVSETSSALSWRAGRFYDLRLSATITLDTIDTDPVDGSLRLYVPNMTVLNTSNNVAEWTRPWGTLNGAFVGGSTIAVTLHGLALPVSDWTEDIQIQVYADAVTAGGDADVSWELAVFDAGPSSAVLL